MSTSQQQTLQQCNDPVNWEITNRSSCDICLEPYDASIVVPRVLSCGHSRCERCISRCLQGNYYTCICQTRTLVQDVKSLLVNRSLIDISDYMSALVIPKSVETCTECDKAIELKWLAVCKTAECAKFDKMICLHCALKKHSQHQYLLFENFMDEIRAKCRDDLAKMNSSAREQCTRVRSLAEEIARNMINIENCFFEKNEKTNKLLEQTENITTEKEAAELLSIGSSLLEPITNELGSMITGLENITASLKITFGEEKTDGEESTLPTQEVGNTKGPQPMLDLEDEDLFFSEELNLWG